MMKIDLPKLPDARNLTQAEADRALLNFVHQIGRAQLQREDQAALARLTQERTARVNAGVGTHGEIVAELIAEGIQPETARKIATASIAARKATPSV